MRDVVEMKKQRWAKKGVDYEAVLRGEIQLVPDAERLGGIAEDHQAAIEGGMFYGRPDEFDQIIDRISRAQNAMNRKI